MAAVKPIKTVGIAGTGLIGAGWAARLLFRGFNVIAYDVSPTAEERLKAADQDSLAVARSPARQAGEEGQAHLHHRSEGDGVEGRLHPRGSA